MTFIQTLENSYWQLGILPEVGGCIAYGRVQHNGQWQNVFRPTPDNQMHNPSATSSFLMLPWANRIQGGRFTFNGQSIQLQTTQDDGTARHGDVRKRAWHIETATATTLTLSLRTSDYSDLNFPFAFSSTLHFELTEADFKMAVSIRNEGNQPMPCGFGHHPYFLRPTGANAPLVEIPCAHYIPLSTDYFPLGHVEPVTPELNFTHLTPVNGDTYNHLLTDLDPTRPTRLVYPESGLEIQMRVDSAFRHMLIFTPPHETSLAIEPMTIATNGFNIPPEAFDSGMWILAPQETRTASIYLKGIAYE